VSKTGIIAALAVAVVLLFLPPPKVERPETPPEEEAELIQPDELSQWIVAGDHDYLLIDLRSKEAFEQNAIKTAICVPSSKLEDPATVQSLPPHRAVVLYADNTADALAAWRALRPYHPDVYVLDGGVAAWKARVLNPDAPPADAPETAWEQYRERLALANYFSGKTAGAPVERPRAVTPVLRPRAAGVVDEGC